MLRLTTMLRAHLAATQVRRHGASDPVDQFIDGVTPHHDPGAQELRLGFGVRCCGL
jgi:hypothetical protein